MGINGSMVSTPWNKINNVHQGRWKQKRVFLYTFEFSYNKLQGSKVKIYHFEIFLKVRFVLSMLNTVLPIFITKGFLKVEKYFYIMNTSKFNLYCTNYFQLPNSTKSKNIDTDDGTLEANTGANGFQVLVVITSITVNFFVKCVIMRLEIWYLGIMFIL